MSIETLRKDLNDNLEALRGMAIPTADALKQHLVNSFWPFIESMVDEMDEIDEAVDDLVSGAPEILHSESAEVFSGIIVSGELLMTELSHRVGNDARILAMIKEWRGLARQGKSILEDIALPDPDPDPDDPDPDEPDGAEQTDGKAP